VAEEYIVQLAKQEDQVMWQGRKFWNRSGGGQAGNEATMEIVQMILGKRQARVRQRLPDGRQKNSRQKKQTPLRKRRLRYNPNRGGKQKKNSQNKINEKLSGRRTGRPGNSNGYITGKRGCYGRGKNDTRPVGDHYPDEL